MREFKVCPISSIALNRQEVETVVECSALMPLNVSEVFYFAQKAVLHPTAPLYDSREHALKPKCLDALKRIFKISDVDKDGLLNATELNQFQVCRSACADVALELRRQQKCFSAPLQSQELEGILELVRSYDPAAVLPVPSTPSTPLPRNHSSGQLYQSSTPMLSPAAEGITEIGFLYLHTIFIQQGRMETTWTVLRKFGYGEGLDLREDFLLPRYIILIASESSLHPGSMCHTIVPWNSAPSAISSLPTSLRLTIKCV